MEAGPQGPRHLAAETGHERPRAGRAQHPELPMNWNSAKAKSWLEWTYRHSHWKPRDQGLLVEQRPRTARPTRSRRPYSGAANPGLLEQSQTAQPERPISSLSTGHGSARTPSEQCRSAQTDIDCQQIDTNADDSDQNREEQRLRNDGRVLFLPCKPSLEEPAQKLCLLSGQTSSVTEQLEALAVACVDEVSAVETRMRGALSTRYPKTVHPKSCTPKHHPRRHHDSADVTPRASNGKHVDTGLPENARKHDKRPSMYETRVGGTLDDAMSSVATHKRLLVDADRAETTMYSMHPDEAARLGAAAAKQMTSLTTNLKTQLNRLGRKSLNSLGRKNVNSLGRKSVNSPPGASPKARVSASKSGNWRSQRRGGAVQVKASLSGGEEVQARLNSAFAGTAAQVRKVEQAKQDSLSLWELQQIAIQLAYPFSEVQYAKKIFDELDANQNGSIEYLEFEKASIKMVGEEVPAREVRRICREVWTQIADESTKTIGFKGFLTWYVNQKFCPEAKPSQVLAFQNNVSVEMVEYVMRNFETVDTDKSGVIEMNEFAEVLYKIMRIPTGVELPASRIQSLWIELDCSRDSKVSFEEFLPWWLSRKDTLLPYEGFYSSIRRLGTEFLDPPAYPKALALRVD
eukprot:TRINITY_DN74132_c0_g1_i1.p1 TRINITY_DN74132_c0_g1~~TRINITY_DN74132_c0_g1_i1.p1  ORF type:complete len:631 (-),score=90.46 TRINITY_DN74132_c0_g1_i1:55-1947(-)